MSEYHSVKHGYCSRAVCGFSSLRRYPKNDSEGGQFEQEFLQLFMPPSSLQSASYHLFSHSQFCMRPSLYLILQAEMDVFSPLPCLLFRYSCSCAE